MKIYKTELHYFHPIMSKKILWVWSIHSVLSIQYWTARNKNLLIKKKEQKVINCSVQ